MFTSNELMILILGVVVVLLSLSLLLMCVLYNKTKRTIDDMKNFIYQLMRQNDTSTNSIVEVSKMTNTTNETLSTLTSSIRSVMKKVQHDNDQKVYPGPQLLELIDKCITENVLMEATLIHNDPMPENTVAKVANIVIQTFPHVVPDYLIQRTTYVMEEFIASKSGRKSQ